MGTGERPTSTLNPEGKESFGTLYRRAQKGVDSDPLRGEVLEMPQPPFYSREYRVIDRSRVEDIQGMVNRGEFSAEKAEEIAFNWGYLGK